MQEYTDKDLQYIDVPRGFLSQTGEIDDVHMSAVISSNGRIGWLGGNGRPDVAAAHSIIAGEYKNKSPQLVKMCNDAVKQAKDHNIELIIWPIPWWELRFVGFADSSFDPKGIRHQHGWINGTTNHFLNANEKAPVSVLCWKSRKLP